MFHEDWAIRGRIGWSINIKMKPEYEDEFAECQGYNCVQLQDPKKRQSVVQEERRVETLQGYGDNDKWTLSELLLDIEKTTDETQTCCPHNEDKAKKSKEVGTPKQEWLQCDKCEKWRRVSPRISADDLPDVWY
jgi:hypothetical protein